MPRLSTLKSNEEDCSAKLHFNWTFLFGGGGEREIVAPTPSGKQAVWATSGKKKPSLNKLARYFLRSSLFNLSRASRPEDAGGFAGRPAHGDLGIILQGMWKPGHGYWFCNKWEIWDKRRNICVLITAERGWGTSGRPICAVEEIF